MTERFPALEHRLVGLWLDRWDRAGRIVGAQLIEAAIERVQGSDGPAPVAIDLRIHSESADHRAERIGLAEVCGFGMFQEKQGFLWTDIGQPLDRPRRLHIRRLPEVSRGAHEHIVS